MARITEYYGTTEYLRSRMRSMGRSLPFDPAAPGAWQEKAREKLRDILKLDLLLPTNPAPRLVESVSFPDYRREKWLIDTEPGVTMPFFQLLPKDLKDGEKRPMVIVPHGHGPANFPTVDARDYEDYAATLAGREPDGHPNFALDAVRRGYIVFAPCARGAGERRESMTRAADDFGKNSHRELNNIAISLGLSLIGMMTWDLMRLADYALSLPCADGRIAAAGMSGGGQQTLFLAAVDERIRCAIVSGWFYGFEGSFLDLPQNCACNFTPELWRWFDCGDLGCLIAPRPLLIESGAKDHLEGPLGLDNVYPQVAIARSAFSALGDSEALWHKVHDGGHEWRCLGAMDFIGQYLPL